MGLWTDFNLEQRRLHTAANGTYPFPELDPFGGLIPRLRVREAVSLVNYWTSAMEDHDAPAETQTTFWERIDTASADLTGDLADFLDPTTALSHWNAFQDLARDMDASATAADAAELNTILRAFGESLDELPQTIGAAAGAVVSGIGAGLEAFLKGLSPVGLVLLLGVGWYVLNERKG